MHKDRLSSIRETLKEFREEADAKKKQLDEINLAIGTIEAAINISPFKHTEFKWLIEKEGYKEHSFMLDYTDTKKKNVRIFYECFDSVGLETCIEMYRPFGETPTETRIRFADKLEDFLQAFTKHIKG